MLSSRSVSISNYAVRNYVYQGTEDVSLNWMNIICWGIAMPNCSNEKSTEYDTIIREIVELERTYFTEKRNVKTERQKKLGDLIERYTKAGDSADDS